MPRRKDPPPSLPLFAAEPMTSEQAWAIVDRVPVGVRVAQGYTRCAGGCCRRTKNRPKPKGHGPYWFARWILPDGRRARRYIGSDARLALVKRAWAIVQAEVDAASEAASRAVEPPEVTLARQLAARAHGPKHARTREPQQSAIDVPILRLGTK
jgi:hypothetical protein